MEFKIFACQRNLCGLRAEPLTFFFFFFPFKICSSFYLSLLCFALVGIALRNSAECVTEHTTDTLLVLVTRWFEHVEQKLKIGI